jgi:hypothetical protein
MLEELASSTNNDTMDFPAAVLAIEYKVRLFRIVEEPKRC